MSVIGRTTRVRIREVLDLQDRAVSMPELQALLPDLDVQEIRNALMRMIKSGIVHSTGTIRAGAPPSYELWEHVTARMRCRANQRVLREIRSPMETVGVRALNARRIA